MSLKKNNPSKPLRVHPPYQTFVIELLCPSEEVASQFNASYRELSFTELFQMVDKAICNVISHDWMVIGWLSGIEVVGAGGEGEQYLPRMTPCLVESLVALSEFMRFRTPYALHAAVDLHGSSGPLNKSLPATKTIYKVPN